MPQVAIALLKIGFFVFEAVAGAAAAASLGAGAAVAIGAAVVVGGVLVAKQAMALFEIEMPAVDTDASRQRTVKGTTEPQKIIYGEALVSGPISFIGLSGTDNSDLYQTIVLAGHELTDITDIHMDDVVITDSQINGGSNAGGNVTAGIFGPKNSNTICVIKKHLGEASQTADSLLTGTFANYTSAHRGDGIAYLTMKWVLNEDSAETWEKYAPQNVKALVQGKSIYDPRLEFTAVGTRGQDTTNANYIAYSTNPSLCVADYLMDTYLGMSIPASKIDWDAVTTAADGCDATVNVPGGTESRFTCNGVIFATDSHQKNINKILSAMNGNLVYSNGKYIVHAGIYEAPTETLTEDDLTAAISIKTSLERSDRFNTIKGLFIDPAQNHKSSEFPKVQLADAVTRDNNEILEKEVQFPMTNSSYMAQRLAHKLIQLSDQQKIVTFPANLSALRITAGDRVQVSIEELNWSNKVFQCAGWTFSEDGGVNLTLREDSSTSYDDPTVTPTNEYSTVTATGSITDAFRGVPSPSGLTVTPGLKSNELNWVNPGKPNDFGTIYVYASRNANFSSAVKIGETDGTQFVHDASNKSLLFSAGVFNIGDTYTIRDVGTTDFTAIGASANTAGVVFTATGAGSGTGKAWETVVPGNTRYYWVRAVKNVGTDAASRSNLEPNADPNTTVFATVGDVEVDWDNVADPTIGIDINNDTISINTGVANTTTGQAVATSGIEAGTTVTQGGITMNQGGSIKGGQSAYNSGTGFFLGYDTNAYKFSIGNASNQSLTFNGANLAVTGAVNASSGAFTGDVSTDSKFIAGSGATSATMDGGDQNYKFYAGAASAGASPFKVDAQGTVTADRIIITRPNDPSAVIFDSSQDGLVGIGLSSLSSETDNAVAEVADELTSNTDYTRLIISTTQTITVKTLFPLGYLPFAINSEEDFPDSITLQLQVASVTNGVPGTFNNVALGSKTFTRRVFSSGAASDDNYYSVYNSGNGWYVKGKDAVDGQFNLVYSRSGVFTPGDVAYRVQVSFVAGSGSGSGNPDTSSSRTLYYTSSTQYFTVDSSGIIRDQAPGSILTGDVILSAASGVRSISWRDSDTQDETFTIEAKPDINESGSNTMFIKYNNGSTAPFAFVGDNGNLLIAGDFYTGTGAVTAATANISGDINLKAANSDVGINWVDSDDSVRAWSMYANPNQPSTLYIEYNPDGAGTSPGWAFANNGNFLVTGTVYADGAASNSTQWKTGYDYSQIGHLPLTGGTISQDLTITGNLTVNGTTTTVDTDNLTVKDNNITLNYSTGDSSSTANNAGITIQDAVDSTTDASILWKTATDTFEFSHGLVAPTIVSGDIDIGDGTAREELKIKSNSYAEVQYFIKHANNSNVLTEYMRAGVAVTDSNYNQVIGDYFLYSPQLNKMLVTVPQNGDPLRRNDGAITIIDTTNYGTYALPLTGGTLSGNLLTTGTLQFDVGTGTDKSNIIQAGNFPSEGYTASTQKYWLEYKTKGGHHFVVNTDGGSAGAENDFDHFTIWQGAIDGMQLFRLTNTGNATLRQKLTSSGLVSSTTGSSYQTGTPAAIFKDTTSRGTVRIRSDADKAAELFFDVNGAIAWDISARNSVGSYDLNFYGRSSNPDLSTVGGPFFTIKQDGFADASAGFKVNTTTVIDSNRQIFAKTGTQVGEDGTYAGYGVIGFGGITNGYNRVFGRDDNADGLFLAAATGRGIYIRPNGGSSDLFGFSSTGQFLVSGVSVLDQSRNLSNIGSYSGSGRITISGSENIPIKVTGTNSANYAEVQIYNDSGAGLIIGSIGSTYSSAAFAGSRYLYSTAGELRIKAKTNLKLYSGGTGDTEHLAVTFDASRNATFAGTVTSTLQGNNFVMDGHADAKGLVMTPDSSTTYPVFLKSLNPTTGGGEASPWIYREQVENWGVFHNNPINTLDFTRGDSGGSYTLIGTDVGGGNNEVTHRFDMANGNVYHHGNAYIGESLFFGVSGASSFIGRESTVNLGLYADGVHRFYTYNGGWGERVNINDGQLAVYGSILQQNTDHSYLRIEADLVKEQMVRFKNSLTNYWYAGLRTSNGLATTADFHIYSAAYANDVFALKTDGSMVVAKGATFNAETYVRDASNAGIRMQTTALGTGSSDGLRVGINSIEAFVWNFEALPLTFATSGQARFQISSTGAANFYTNEITSGNLVSSGYLNVASTASSRFGGDTFSGSVGMYDNASNSYQTPVLVIRKDFSGTGALNTAPVGLFMHNGNGKWVVLSMGAREANTGGNTVSIAGIASERTSGTVNAWATGNLHLWTKNTSTKVTNMVLKSSGDSEIPSGNFYVNGSVLGKGIRSGNRGELHLNGTGTGDVAEIFFGYGSGYTEANIRWGISDRGSTGTAAGLLNFYKGPALSGWVAVATLNANDNTFTVVNGYKVNGTTVIDGSRNIEAANVIATGGINLRRDTSAATGISFYSPTYKNWQIYMSPAGTTSAGANANLTAPTGLAGVTSWALRSRMEGVSTYGWIWETGSGAAGGATATAKMSLQATTGNLQIAGSFTAGANITAYSDERLKDNIKTLDGSKVLEMRGVSFTKDGKAGSGVIAQELERIAPELVEDDGTFKSVAYGNLVGYLIENAKQQQSEIDELKALIKTLMEK